MNCLDDRIMAVTEVYLSQLLVIRSGMVRDVAVHLVNNSLSASRDSHSELLELEVSGSFLTHQV